MLVDEPAQIVVVPPTVLLAGSAFIVTLAVNAVPVHPLATGVMVYFSTPPAVLTRVWAIVFPHDELQLDAPVIVPLCTAAVQVNVVPVTVEFKATLVVPPVHIDCAEAEPTGLGFTIIVAVIGSPSQKVGVGPVGVMVKVTVTGADVVLVSATPVILEPVPLDAIPVTAVVLSRVQLKVVPLIVGLVLKVMVVKAEPEHIVCAPLVTSAVGKLPILMVRLALAADPQAPAEVSDKVTVPVLLAAGV